tara:strand:+ start:6073 stop:6474 length:402 start_codon:yes stop_codon:yes gene_type:complete
MKEANMARKALCIMLLIPSLTGCGALLVDGPPVGWEDVEDPSELEAVALMAPCSNGKALVFADGFMAAAYGALLVAELGGEPNYLGDPVSTSLAFGAFVFSAWSGNQKVNDCKAFNAHVYQQLRNSAEGNDTR